MKPSLNHRLLQQDGLSTADARSLVDTALTLKRAALAGIDQPLLRGKNIALLCTDPQCQSATDFDKAASDLGARVSRIEPDQALLHGDAGSMRMLARLYDAVECDELPDETVQRLQQLIGVPVFNGLSRPEHPLSRLLAELNPPAADDQHYLVQAVLLQTVA